MFTICERCGVPVYFTLIDRHVEEHERWDRLSRLVADVANEVTKVEEALGTLDEPGPLLKRWTQ